MNTPNKLTVMRMLITPVFLAFYLIKDIPHSALWALIIFLIASVTDAVDGRLARKYNQVTVFGKLADPVADKMLTQEQVFNTCFPEKIQGFGEVGGIEFRFQTDVNLQ